MQLTLLPPAPPPGDHYARLIAINDIIGRWESPAFQWLFQVEGSAHAGTQITKVTGIEFKLNESLATLVSSLLGKTLVPGFVIELESLIGKVFIIKVGMTRTNHCRIESIIPSICEAGGEL